MKSIFTIVALLTGIEASATDCQVALYTHSGPAGEGIKSATGIFGTKSGGATVGAYRFSVFSSSHGETQYLTITQISSNILIFKERNNIYAHTNPDSNSFPKIWEAVVNSGNEKIVLECRWE